MKQQTVLKKNHQALYVFITSISLCALEEPDTLDDERFDLLESEVVSRGALAYDSDGRRCPPAGWELPPIPVARGMSDDEMSEDEEDQDGSNVRKRHTNDDSEDEMSIIRLKKPR